MRIGRSRGQAVLIGAIFVVVITFIISSNIFLWSIQKHDQYNQVVIACNQMDADQRNEKIMLSDANFTLLTNKVRVNSTLFNQGTVPVQFITLWAVDVTLDRYNYNTSLRSMQYSMDPGDKLRVIADVEIQGVQQGDNLGLWLVTARGNTVSLQVGYVTVAKMAQSIGPLQLNFNTIRWTSTGGPPNSGDYQIPSGKSEVTWKIDVTNNGVIDITLDGGLGTGSCLRIFASEAGQVGVWYTATSTTLPMGRTVTLTFSLEDSKTPLKTGIYPVMVTLIGHYGTNPNAHFGETINYEAVKVY